MTSDQDEAATDRDDPLQKTAHAVERWEERTPDHAPPFEDILDGTVKGPQWLHRSIERRHGDLSEVRIYGGEGYAMVLLVKGNHVKTVLTADGMYSPMMRGAVLDLAEQTRDVKDKTA